MATKIARVGAVETVQAALALFADVPGFARRSITLDNGSEFTKHMDNANGLNLKTYFADPYSSWQRGTNEHFNGRIRRFIPKRTSFTELTDQELYEYVTEINNQPRKRLNWKTPPKPTKKSYTHTTTPLHFKIEFGCRRQPKSPVYDWDSTQS